MLLLGKSLQYHSRVYFDVLLSHYSFSSNKTKIVNLDFIGSVKTESSYKFDAQRKTDRINTVIFIQCT
jgi:hypothetical protein